MNSFEDADRFDYQHFRGVLLSAVIAVMDKQYKTYTDKIDPEAVVKRMRFIATLTERALTAIEAEFVQEFSKETPKDQTVVFFSGKHRPEVNI